MFLSLYQLLWTGLRFVAETLAKWLPQHAAQLVRLSLAPSDLESLHAARHQKKWSVLFFCSSAGEYEQAKPLARIFQEERDAFVLIVFGSASGVRFASAQGEEARFILAPWDQPREWAKLFAAIQPNLTVIVRYELWPAFLREASLAGPVYLIDGVQSESLRRSRLSRWLWRQLLETISHIFVVGEEDRAFYKSYLARAEGDLSLVGDTKYDRVLERMEERATKRQKITETLSQFTRGHRILLLGSAWPDDLIALLQVYQHVREVCPTLKLIIAPHDVSEQMAQRMLGMLKQAGLSACQTSRVGLDAASESDDVLLVDQIGLLPEMYALADVAWVGGAMHHRVHNVLEPSCWGLYVCFGPLYKTSQEAKALVQRGLAKVIHDGAEFAHWFLSLDLGSRPPHKALWEAVEAERGASRRILKRIEQDLKMP